jgi:hypothetical protein
VHLLQIDGGIVGTTARAELQPGLGKSSSTSSNSSSTNKPSSSSPTGLCAYVEMKSLVVVVPPNAAAIACRVLSRWGLLEVALHSSAYSKARQQSLSCRLGMCLLRFP